jgi:lysophospholipase L1-like esterase
MNVIFFGDSICNGQYVCLSRGWVGRIAAQLSDWAAEHGQSVIVANASINGRTTRQALEDMPRDVQKPGVDLLVVQFGMNDCNLWETDRGLPRVSPAAFAANLREIIERGWTFGARAIALHTNHPSGRDRPPFAKAPCTYEEQNRTYNQIIRDVAHSDSRLHLHDMEALFLRHTGGDRGRLHRLLLPDLLHLSEEGHDLYFQHVAPQVLTLVTRVSGELRHAAR